MPIANPHVTSIRDLPQWEQNLLRSGMRSPRLRKMSAGTKVYRVGSAASAAAGATRRADPEAGGWWFGQKAFNKIMADCVQHDSTNGGLGWSARRAMAVLFGWSDCDVLVEGYLTESVALFYGKGHKQSEMSPVGKVTYEGWKDVDQWYLPGMTERVSGGGTKTHTKLSSLGKSAIHVYRTCSIRSYKWYSPV